LNVEITFLQQTIFFIVVYLENFNTFQGNFKLAYLRLHLVTSCGLRVASYCKNTKVRACLVFEYVVLISVHFYFMKSTCLSSRKSCT